MIRHPKPKPPRISHDGEHIVHRAPSPKDAFQIDVNVAMLFGWIGRRPLTRRVTNSKTTVTHFKMLTVEKWIDYRGDRNEHMDWHRIVAWNELGHHLKVGLRVHVTGRIQTRRWKDNLGCTQMVVEIVATEIVRLPQGEEFTASVPEWVRAIDDGLRDGSPNDG